VPVILRRAWAVLIATGLAVLTPLQASAEQSHEESLRQARELLDHQEYERVLGVTDPLSQDEAAPASIRVTAMELSGVAHLLLRRQSQAQRVFEALLALDPGHSLSDPSYPPRISEFFNMVRESLGEVSAAPVELEGEPPQGVGAGEPIELAVRIATGRERVERVVVLLRAAGDEDYQERAMDCVAEGACELNVEAPAETGTMELYVEARAPSGHPLGGIGTATAPLNITIEELGTEADPGTTEPPPPRPWYATWWFWTAVGVGVAAVVGGVTAGVLLYEPPEPEAGTMGYARLP
jgi:hypothetical protein